MHWSRETPEIKPCINSQLILNKVPKTYIREKKNIIFNSSTWKTEYPYVENKNLIHTI